MITIRQDGLATSELRIEPKWTKVVSGDPLTLPVRNKLVMVVNDDGVIAFARRLGRLNWNEETKEVRWACSIDDFNIVYWAKVQIEVPEDVA